MISKEKFTEYILNYQAFEQAISRMEEAFSGRKYGCNLFDCDWVDSVGKMLDIFIESHFTETGGDLIYWWMFEDIDHIIYQKIENNLFENEKEIKIDINNIENLYDYLLKNGYTKT